MINQQFASVSFEVLRYSAFPAHIPVPREYFEIQCPAFYEYLPICATFAFSSHSRREELGSHGVSSSYVLPLSLAAQHSATQADLEVAMHCGMYKSKALTEPGESHPS